jgi:N-methylhydantoinase B
MADIYAQLAANRTGERRFVEILERFGVEAVAEAAKALQDYSERLARDAIRAIPDGRYEAEDFVDDNGFTTEPPKVKVAVAVDGDRLRVDFTGSARENKGMVNSPVCSTIGAVALLLGGGTIPVNDPSGRVSIPTSPSR